MEELLGLDAGDFEGVEFAESSDSDNEQDTSSGGRMAAAETNDSTSGEDGTVAAPPPAAPASSTVTTVMKVCGTLFPGGSEPDSQRQQSLKAIDLARTQRRDCRV